MQNAIRPSVPAASSLARVGFFLCVFLAIWGAKLTTIGKYGTDVPYWDQWAKEGEFLYVPWYQKGEFWRHVFIPHNEHRIAPTLAMNLGLLEAGGDQWDARVQCVASAAVQAFLAAGLCAWALAALGRRWGIACSLLVVAATAPPIAWDNVLGGFQSQFHFLALFSLIAIAALLGSRAFSWSWFGGILAALLAIVSMGSGFLVVGPIAAVAAVRLARAIWLRHAEQTDGGGSQKWDAVATLAAAFAVGAFGLWLRSEAPWHEPFHAHSVSEYAMYVARCLAWPLYEQPWKALVLWAPWALLLGVRLFRRVRGGSEAALRNDEFIIAAGLWVLLQVAAVSYSRAGASVTPASRYGDTFALGLIFSAFALARLFRGYVRPAVPRAWLAVPAVWFVIVFTGLGQATSHVIRNDLPRKKQESAAYEQNVRAFLATNDYAAFEKAEIPFPSAEWLARMLRNPTLRPLLPASVTGRPRSTLSATAVQLTRNGPAIAVIAFAGVLGLGFLLLRAPAATSAALHSGSPRT